jgi:hypothetical protein
MVVDGIVAPFGFDAGSDIVDGRHRFRVTPPALHAQ